MRYALWQSWPEICWPLTFEANVFGARYSHRLWLCVGRAQRKPTHRCVVGGPSAPRRKGWRSARLGLGAKGRAGTRLHRRRRLINPTVQLFAGTAHRSKPK